MPTLKSWIYAARLRTLPLAFASIFMGTALAAGDGSFDGVVFALALLTTLFYQVLSNYANDYGDGLRGTDDNRVGEQRAVASGAISSQQMQRAVWLFALLSIASGTTLSFLAAQGNTTVAYWFTGLGLLAVLAAIGYTMGKVSYGYRGLGDLAVLIFFGGVGVGGSYFLQTLVWDPLVLLPAASLGLLANAVLNLNNMRDLENDRLHGKHTLALRFGLKGAKVYHALLLLLAFDAAFLYNRLHPASVWQNLYFLALPLLVINLRKVLKAQQPKNFEPLLKQMALSTLFFALCFGLGRMI